jgi:hypothetical protein
MKINLGCGYNKKPGFINVDKDPRCQPDLLFDCEKEWPIETSTVEEMYIFHTLEHLGETVEKFIILMKEMYRVSKNECVWKITVPHYNSDIFHIDPTHVRKICPTTMRMFDQNDNIRDIKEGGHYTKLGLMYNIDIEVVKDIFYLSEPWNTYASSNQKSSEEINFAGKHYNNIGGDIYIECRVHKPQRGLNFKF